MWIFYGECWMLNKTKGFLFKELFHVWEKNGFCPMILVWSMGVERVGVSSHCTRLSARRRSCGVMGRICHAPVLFYWIVKSGQPDTIKVWFPTQQTDLWNVCQVAIPPFTAKSTPAKRGTWHLCKAAGCREMRGWVSNILFKCAPPVMQNSGC